MLQSGQTQNPATGQFADNSQPVLSTGRQGDVLVGPVGGQYRAMALRGAVFYMSTLIAGVALPVNAATLVSKFTLYNPAGSGKLVELIEFTMGIDSATEVVNGIAMGIQKAVSTSGGAPGTLTGVSNLMSTYLGSGGLTSVCSGYIAATLTNVAVLPTYPLGMNFDATAAGRSGNFVYNFDGKFIVPPDCLVTFCTTVAAETALPAGLTWSEFLA